MATATLSGRPRGRIKVSLEYQPETENILVTYENGEHGFVITPEYANYVALLIALALMETKKEKLEKEGVNG